MAGPGVGVDNTAAVNPADAVVQVIGDVEVPLSVKRHAARARELRFQRRAFVAREAQRAISGDDAQPPLPMDTEREGVLTVGAVDAARAVYCELLWDRLT